MYRHLFSFTLPVELCSGRRNCGATQSFGEKLCLAQAVTAQALPACRCALRGELLPLIVPPQLKRQPWPPPTVWFSLGRVECLFLELSASHNIHFLRVTRGGRLAWGWVGTWHAFSTPNGPCLCLRSFSCCLGARLREYPTRVAAFRLSRQRMMNGLCSRGEFLLLGMREVGWFCYNM